jgi:hypothetical protein
MSLRTSRLLRSREEGSKGTAIELPSIVLAAHGHDACQLGKPCMAAVGQEKMGCPILGFRDHITESEDVITVEKEVYVV